MAKRRNWGEERLERLEIFRYYSYSFSLKGSETGQGLEIFKIFWAAVQRRNTKKKRRKGEEDKLKVAAKLTKLENSRILSSVVQHLLCRELNG